MRPNQLRNLGDDEELDALPLADPAHAERPLGVVPERHVLGERQHCLGVRGVLDVHSGGVHLVVKRHMGLWGRGRALGVGRMQARECHDARNSELLVRYTSP